MAGHLALAGHAVTVYNRTASQGRSLVREFAAHRRRAVPPRRGEAAEGADIVFCCVGNDDDLRSL
jgi:3-hydroxyisobutyrate dehydrogenase